MITLALLTGGAVHAASGPETTQTADWAVDPAVPGENLPPTGRSLFDFLFVRDGTGGKVYDVPFPFQALLKRVEDKLDSTGANAMRVKGVLIPLGRSLQRTAAAPEYFAFPRVVAVPDAEPRAPHGQSGMLVKDRLYLGYQEKANVIEVISYNEAAGRFEFQIVKDYRPGGTPRVFYANRAICTACHQNAAPIFSRPVWDETNANPRLASRLGKERRTFYGIPPERGVDVPNAIDDATDRANLYSVYQRLWQAGCEIPGDAGKSARCRAELLRAALRYGLSGAQQFDETLPAFRNDVIATLAASARRWPAGLGIPNPDIPNRDPFGPRNIKSASGVRGGHHDTIVQGAYADYAEVQPAFDPLAPRSALERWSLSEPATARRLVSGLAGFFARSDMQRLDERLQTLSGRGKALRQDFEGECRMTRTVQSARTYRVDFECAPPAGSDSAAVGASGRFYVAASRVTHGTVDRLRFAADAGATPALTNMDVAGGSVSARGERIVATLRLGRSKGSVRRGNGTAVKGLEFIWPSRSDGAGRTSAGRMVVTVLDDFAPVHQAIDSMLRDAQAGALDTFSEKPFRRAVLLPALFARLGMAPVAWCCVDTSGMPAATMEMHTTSAEAAEQARAKPVELQPFYRYCATCHQSAERFPPNFLSGSAKQVSANLDHCAPRLFVRLSMWKLEPDARPKTAMPPDYALHGFHVSPDTWRKSDELAALGAYVEKAFERQTGKPPRLQEVMQRGYENLPACLPGSG